MHLHKETLALNSKRIIGECAAYYLSPPLPEGLGERNRSRPPPLRGLRPLSEPPPRPPSRPLARGDPLARSTVTLMK